MRALITSAYLPRGCSPSRWSGWFACAGAGVKTVPIRGDDCGGSFALVVQPTGCAAASNDGLLSDAGDDGLRISVPRWT